jgi:hypothetical protein
MSNEPTEKLVERKWAASLVTRLEQSLQRYNPHGGTIGVVDGRRLAYTCEIHEYTKDDHKGPRSANYQTDLYETDLLIFDVLKNGSWIPRVIVEGKLRLVSTHDALTYSAKAATHKHVHPYLRYGILLGERKHYAIPVRLIKHGAYFDFMIAWQAAEPSKTEWPAFITLLGQEIDASRTMLKLLKTNRSLSRDKYNIFHKPLVVK